MNSTPAPLHHPASRSRIAAFDLARGLAVLFMVWVHVLEFFSRAELHDSLFGWIFGFLGTVPAAPVFMFVMGALIGLSKHNHVRSSLLRALGLFALAYLLNVLRGVAPKLLALQLEWVSLEDLAPYTPAFEFFIVDILQFAALGLAFLCMVRRLLPNPAYWLALALVVTTASPYLWGTYTGITAFDRVLDLLWGVKQNGVMFPFFPWITYPMIGMAFGHWLQHGPALDQVFRKALQLGLLLLALGGALTLTNVEYHTGDYYRSGPGYVVWACGFVLVWVWGCLRLTEYFSDNRAFRLLFFWSRNVTVYYVMQWLIIGWAVVIIGPENLGALNTLLMMLSVLILADISTRVWLRFSQRAKSAPLAVKTIAG